MTNPAFCCRGWATRLPIEGQARNFYSSAAAPYLLVSLHIGAFGVVLLPLEAVSKQLGAASRL